MKHNYVNTSIQNDALLSLITDSIQIITLDANFIIPPDRSKENSQVKAIPFEWFKTYWLKPLLYQFPYLAIHEAVQREIQTELAKKFVADLVYGNPPLMILLSDAVFTDFEEIFRKSVEARIAYYTSYDPIIDNSKDRGEVKSLAHIATRGLLFFCSHDSQAIRLIEQTEQLNTQLDSVKAIRFYEIIYFLAKKKLGVNQALRTLYKYIYHLTLSDKKCNPTWSEFLEKMDQQYLEAF